MDKIVNGRIYKKARFLRTTCKACGKELSHCSIMSGYGWCNKKCKQLWIQKQNKKPHKMYTPIETDNESDELCSSSCNSGPFTP